MATTSTSTTTTTATATMPAIVRLARSTNIDVDSLDPSLARKLLSLGVTANDQTSNQVLIVQAILDPQNAQLVKEVTASMPDAPSLAIVDHISVLLSKRNDGLIKGRFLLQTSPQGASDMAAIIAHARNYAKEFEMAGLPKERFCIKLPATGAGVNAAKVLEGEGIRTLGTSLFSVPQALACSQAGCLSISPYFNEIPAHDRTTNLWPQPADVAREHPMSPRMVQIYQAYADLERHTGRTQPLIKAASMIGGKEAMAIGEEMGAQHLTCLAPVLKELFEMQVSGDSKKAEINTYATFDVPERLKDLLQVDPLSPGGKPYTIDPSLDWLADGGAALDAYIAGDAETAKRLQASLDLFIGAEAVAIEAVERVRRGEGTEGLVFGGL
ncbi:aldolase [Microstroma glucosiphilum]|uniref:Aldolase n=1 Tax=Pseudomicrostroma glucosiphilum TaxID=1684307 RepID=A0A316U557_9BASI|nr:aldolase [Pseudomicrostroma glucosiphilum]PWN19581.1 aldolase [Pseudomicrostroma glucosiphilum]